MTYGCADYDVVIKRIADALEGIEKKMTPAEVVEYGPETVEAVRKLLSDISGDIEEALKAPMARACSWFWRDVNGDAENLYKIAIGDFMEVFHRELDKIEYEMKMKKEGKE